MHGHGRPRGGGPHGVAVVTDHIAQLRAMLAFERSLVDRVGPPGCAARETAAANVAALEWVLETLGRRAALAVSGVWFTPFGGESRELDMRREEDAKAYARIFPRTGAPVPRD